MADRTLNKMTNGNSDSDPVPQQFDLRNDPDLCWAAWVFCAGIAVISAGLAVYMLWLGR